MSNGGQLDFCVFLGLFCLNSFKIHTSYGQFRALLVRVPPNVLLCSAKENEIAMDTPLWNYKCYWHKFCYKYFL